MNMTRIRRGKGNPGTLFYITLVDTIVNRTLKVNLYRKVKPLPLHHREKLIDVKGINVLHSEALRKTQRVEEKSMVLNIEAVVRTESSVF